MMRMSVLALTTAVLIGGGTHVQAAPTTGSVPLTDINFDLWCQEQAKLPPDRCDKRLPADDAKFEAYRKTIQDYEVPYLQQRDQDDNLNRVIFHNDPVDHPPTPSQPKDPNPPDSPPK
jgi:hypothetical protein